MYFILPRQIILTFPCPSWPHAILSQPRHASPIPGSQFQTTTVLGSGESQWTDPVSAKEMRLTATSSSIASHTDVLGASSHVIGNAKKLEESIQETAPSSMEWAVDYEAFDA